MRIEAEFVTSAAGPEGFANDGTPEIALVGRSNVGKSTLINALIGRTLARTSAKPGKTRLVNLFRVTGGLARPFYLVDLPGYGYARGGEASKREFDTIAAAYFQSPHARGVLHLVDIRHPGLEPDHQAAEWLLRRAVPRAVIATKLDKLTRSERVKNVAELERLHEGPVLAVSAHSGEGLKELWKTIDALLRQPTPTNPKHA